ncbi:glycosyltransferase family 69 protein [Aulographum hederae CBS 113979]|uniref:Glycosyltransferase family 69 protein n=1 Tax=Aulographum hederae CBS 113979 TaxID=1176131 RepID=A0A6G1H595_9PEZI|nr:glycosyltransferase family 69 protein [Aulographum hederae CBS 113979]
MIVSMRSLRRSICRLVLAGLRLLLLVDFYHIAYSYSPSKRVPPILSPRLSLVPRIFIASIHWNNEAILRSHWNKAVLDLVRYFGAENIYVCKLESGGLDNSKAALRELETKLERLGVQKFIELDPTTHQDEIEHVPSPGEPGWIWTRRGGKELRRIPYLSRIRNRAIQKMDQLAKDKKKPLRFDKVLWLNDVVFTTEDVLTLLQTRDGEYAAACSLDFAKPPLYYDTFALRDSGGTKPVTQKWPYFNSYSSRHALVSNKPIPVRSCWNGMTVFDAAPFYDKGYTSRPLRFRGIPDSLAAYHLEGSECCLIHADNPLTPQKGVWMNPNVRVGYNAIAYDTVNPPTPYWIGTWGRVWGLWDNRFARTTGSLRRALEHFVVGRRLRSWRAEKTVPLGKMRPREEKGVHCLINEMQVLVANGGHMYRSIYGQA